jgi:hypothetical protein
VIQSAESNLTYLGCVSNYTEGLQAIGKRLPIMAHGVTDSIDLLLIFSGHYPTMYRVRKRMNGVWRN